MKVCNNHFKLVILLILILGLCGCYNLGDFESDQDYFDTFNEVELININKNMKSYSTEKYFYTKAFCAIAKPIMLLLIMLAKTKL